jgi:hypothetical protein
MEGVQDFYCYQLWGPLESRAFELPAERGKSGPGSVDLGNRFSFLRSLGHDGFFAAVLVCAGGSVVTR